MVVVVGRKSGPAKAGPAGAAATPLLLDGTLLWAWEFCRYSRIVVISAVVIRKVDCIVMKNGFSKQ